MALTIQIKPWDKTNKQFVFIIGNCRKMMSEGEMKRIVTIGSTGTVEDAGKRLFNYFKKERMDLVREADLDVPKRKKLICEAFVQIIRKNYKLK